MSKHHTVEQIVEKLKIKRQMIKDGCYNPEISRALGVKISTIYAWERKYGDRVK